MEEHIEGLLKEKEATQLAMVPVTTVPTEVASTKPSSSSTTIESTSTTTDPTRLSQELASKNRKMKSLCKNSRT